MNPPDPACQTITTPSSARKVLSAWQIGVISAILVICMLGLYWAGIYTLTFLVSFLALLTSVIYFYGALLMVVALAFPNNVPFVKSKPRIKYDRNELPMYTILAPLYKEAKIFNKLVNSISRLDYPDDKLDIIVLLEADDKETIDAVTAQSLPRCFRVLVVPAGYPRTKPRACNFGLLHAHGEYVVVYDVEDQPEPDQLLKVLNVFQHGDNSVFCVQCRLNYYNARKNILTRLFTLEYSFWFDLLLIGLNKLKAPIPLGGTSNHFQTDALRRIGGWDAFNVTEDCDLGMRIALAGYKTVVIDSTTWEEANSQLPNWFRQRSRWIKGYIQTYFVHMRNPAKSFRKLGPKKFLSFQLVVGGAPLVLICAPFIWIMNCITYFHPITSIQTNLSASVFSFVLYFMICLSFGVFGAIVRHNYDLLPYALLMPIYYALQSYAAWKGLYQLFTKPHYWEKTDHGL
jgi:glycosyltransferase XagB